jgi:hypothetical protein
VLGSRLTTAVLLGAGHGSIATPGCPTRSFVTHALASCRAWPPLRGSSLRSQGSEDMNAQRLLAAGHLPVDNGGVLASHRKPLEEAPEPKRRVSGVRQRTEAPGQSPTSPEFEPSTAADTAAIERMLDETSDRLARTPETPLRWEVYSVVERYRRALAEWTTQPPTRLQRVILFDCVKALHHRVASRSWRKLPGHEG